MKRNIRNISVAHIVKANSAITKVLPSYRAKTIGAALTLLLMVGCGAANSAPPNLAGCQILPTNNVWNAPIDTLPVHASSSAWVNTIGANTKLHPDWGITETDFGIPFTTVPGTQPKVPMVFDVADESDPGPYPFPPNAPIEGGAGSSGDRHVLVIETANCILYEAGNAYPQNNGASWIGFSGAKWDLKSNALRTPGWTSTDAAGLPVFPGLARWEEVAAGEINHALRFTVPATRRGIYQWPATHWATNLADNLNNPMMGSRFRLKASFDISSFDARTQVVLRAMKKYGMIVADNGSAWYISGTSNVNWPSVVIDQLKGISGGNFEAVDVSSMIVNINSGEAKSTTSTPVAPSNSPAIVLDLSGDGKADLLFRDSSNGSTAGWLMNGLTTTASATIRMADPSWSVTHTADFNGDAKADILWRKTDGTVELWLMNGLNVLSTATLLGPNSGWSVTHTGDFNGDGKADILFSHTDGRIAMWLMNGTTLTNGAGLLGAASGWSITHTADFNGDGKADILFRHTDGRIAMWLMNGVALTNGAGLLEAASGWRATHTGDFNGDGKADVLFRHTDGRIALWLMNGLALTNGAGLGVSGIWQVVPSNP